MEQFAFVRNYPRGRLFKEDGGYKDITVSPGVYTVLENSEQQFVIDHKGQEVHLLRTVAIVGSLAEMREAAAQHAQATQLAELERQIQILADNQAGLQRRLNQLDSKQRQAEQNKFMGW